MCAFSITWDEANPTNLTSASSIDDEFRNLKISLRERLAACFTDFNTASDRIRAEKFFLHAVNGLKFRNGADSADLASLDILGNLVIAGALTESARPMAFASRVTTHTNVGALTPITFTSEILDIGNCFDLAGQPTRFVAPVAGKYLILSFLRHNITEDSLGNQYNQVDLFKNGVTSTQSHVVQLQGTNEDVRILTFGETRFWIESMNAADYFQVRAQTSANSIVQTAYVAIIKIG